MIRIFQRVLLISLAIIVMGLLYWGWHYLRRPTTLPFHHVLVVSSVQYIDVQKIQQLAWKNLEGGFFSLDVDKLKAALLKQPWITNVSIRREWPDTIDLVIQERHPEACWGAQGVISSQAKVFYPAQESIPKALPDIVTAAGDKKKILYNFQKLIDYLLLLDLQIKSLNISKRMAYQVTLSNGIVVMIGRDDVLARFHRFVNLYPQIIGVKSHQVKRVDLRYPNGLAVQWKSKS